MNSADRNEEVQLIPKFSKRRRRHVTLEQHHDPLPSVLPNDLLTSGWRVVSPKEVRRFRPDGEYDAHVTVFTYIYEDENINRTFWSGGIWFPKRQLRCQKTNAIDAMRLVEEVEQLGPLSEFWNRQFGAPEFVDWEHLVRSKCHVWHRISPEGSRLIVAQKPCNTLFIPLEYSASVADHILSRDGAARTFRSPASAMTAAEFQARKDARARQNGLRSSGLSERGSQKKGAVGMDAHLV